MKRELLALQKVTLEEKGEKVFNGFNMYLYEKDIYGIICNRIVERNTLVDFFLGRSTVSEGAIRLRRKNIKVGNSQQILNREFYVIGKESNLMASLSIVENICIFMDKKKIVRKKQYYQVTRDIFREFDIRIQIDKPVQLLTEKERVIIEIIKAYAENKKIIVLADLTGFLQKNELSEIYGLIREMRQREYSFILLESFDDIVFTWTNRLLVIKNGKDLGCFEPRFIDRQKLYDFMVGRKAASDNEMVVRTDYEEEDVTTIRFEKVSTAELKDISFSADKGEAIKIYFMNSGSLEAFQNIFFEKNRILSGDIYLEEKRVSCNTIREWREKGVCYSVELSYKNMLIQDMTVRDNLMLELAEKVRGIWMWPRYKKSVDQYIESVLGKDMADRKLRSLPADILQKIQYSRYFLALPKVLICKRPFLEVDLYTREVTLEMFAKMQNRGITIIILTTNLAELNLLDGSNIYIRNGTMVDENEIYQTLYQE